MSMMNDFFFFIPLLSILVYVFIIGFAIYAVVTFLKLAKERNVHLKVIAEDLRRRSKMKEVAIWD